MSTCTVEALPAAPAAIVEYDMSAADSQLVRSWTNYQEGAEPLGLAFGEMASEWRKKYKASGKRMKGVGIRPELERLGIKKSAFYYWLAEYEISIGVRERWTLTLEG